jgi:endoglucanase
MQRFFFLVFIILLNPLIFQPCVAQQTKRVEITDGCFIQSKGTSLAYGKNIPIHLKGVNLGGWLLWEGWIWGKGFISETTIFDKISAVVGKDSAISFREKIHHNFIKEEDIKQIAACGFNVVRIPFNHLLLEDDSLPYHYKNSGWLLLDSVLGWCRKYNVFAVLDLHSAP